MKLIREHYDPHSGITEQYLWDDMTSKLTIRRYQDVDDTINANKEMFNQHSGAQYHDSIGVHQVARIPIMLLEKWYREEGFNWYTASDADRRKKLNDPDYRALLVRPGKL